MLLLLLVLLLLSLSMESHPPARPVLIVVLQILIVDLLLPIRAPVLLPILGGRSEHRISAGQLEQHHFHGAGHEEEAQHREADGQAHQPLHLAQHHRGEEHSPWNSIDSWICSGFSAVWCGVGGCSPGVGIGFSGIQNVCRLISAGGLAGIWHGTRVEPISPMEALNANSLSNRDPRPTTLTTFSHKVRLCYAQLALRVGGQQLRSGLYGST